MVEGQCRYSLQWRVSGRLKEQGELNNVQYMYWEKILFHGFWFLDCCVTAVQFILFNFANYSPSVAMELKVSKEITCK